MTQTGGHKVLFWKHNKKKKTIKPEQLKEMLDQGADIVVLDLRLNSEFEKKGRIQGAINISVEQLEKLAEYRLPEKSKPLVLCCETGEKTDVAADILLSLGYETVYIFGGLNQWKYDLDWSGR